jgi:hypothetical protein
MADSFRASQPDFADNLTNFKLDNCAVLGCLFDFSTDRINDGKQKQPMVHAELMFGTKLSRKKDSIKPQQWEHTDVGCNSSGDEGMEER